MRWHNGNTEPLPERDSHLIIKLHSSDNYRWVTYSREDHQFIEMCGCTVLHHSTDEVEKWCYVEEDDTVMDEITALTAIDAAISHVKDLIQILLTDCIATPKDYREKIGLDDLFAFDKKISDRIIELDNK